MAKNESGEFELLVGNKQLISIVFIMMVLFGAVFSMGYFVGRNSTPEPSAAAGTAKPSPEGTGGVRPEPSGPLAQDSSAAEAPQTSGDSTLAPGEAQVANTETAPVATPNAEAATAAVEATPVQAMPAATVQPQPPSKPAAPPKAAAASAQPSLPAPGQVFLQVEAVKRPEAELVADVLRKKGFPALVAPAVVEGQASGQVYRVLVGPLKDATAVAKSKSDLESAGFKPIVRKY